MENFNQTSGTFSSAPQPQKSNTGLKIAVGLLAAVLLIFGVVGVKKYKDFKSENTELQQEKQALINDLEELKVNYDNALNENSQMKSELEEAKNKVESLIAEIQNVKATDMKIIRRYKNELYRLKKEKEKLFKTIDSLKQANQLLTYEKDSIGQEYDTLQKQHQQVLEENKQLAETVLKAKTLAATNIVAAGVKIKKSGKVVETGRSRKAQQIRICMSLPKNPVLEPGAQTIYAEVINPKGEVIGSKDVIQVNGEEKIISGAKEIHYDGSAMDVCIFVLPQDKDAEIVKGDYVINLYHNGQKIGETNLHLK